ncbi:MAG TPA: transposase [Caulobacteraceae bacterium]|nr:transposase [Caulobacteraceae bacterium]
MPCDDVTRRVEAHRIEVFTGAGPRRRWSTEDKARIVAESYSGAGTVCDVARRHGLAQTQLFTWRREARMKALPESEPELKFAPVVVERAPPPTLAARKRRRGRRGDGGIELEIDGVMVRVGRGAEAKTVAAVIRALKAER